MNRMALTRLKDAERVVDRLIKRGTYTEAEFQSAAHRVSEALKVVARSEKGSK